MAKITFLGTAASIPSKNRDNTSFLFTYKGLYLLVDCSGSIVYKLKKLGINYKKIRHIIITHEHPDHLYGLPHFIHACAYTSMPLYIFSNKKTLNIIKKMVGLFKLNSKDYPSVHYIDVFKKPIFFSLKNLYVKAVPNKHKSQSFGVLFNWKNKSLFYSSDTALSKKIIQTALECTYLIHDCTASSYFFNRHPSLYRMHTDAKSLTRTFKDTLLKKIIPIHFLLSNKKETMRIKKELQPLKQKIIIPRDFQTIIL